MVDKNNSLERISVMVNKEDLIFLKEKGINRSALFRQAIQALKEKKLVYKYI